MEESTKKPTKLRFEAKRLPGKIREILIPQDGMAKGTVKGLQILGTLDDRTLTELFIQVHVREIEKEKVLQPVGEERKLLPPGREE